MGIPLSLNFDMGSQLPLDSRTVKADVTARDAIPAGQRFEGLTVYVIADLKKYVLKGGILNANWAIDGGGAGTDLGNTADYAKSGFSARFGAMFTSTGLDDTLNKILLLTYAAPGISLGTSPSTALREKGTSVASVTMTANTTKFSNNITRVRFYRNGVLVNTDAAPTATGGTSTYTNNTAFTDDMNFMADVYDGTSVTNSNTVYYSYVYPYYYGAGAVGKTPAQVAALTKNVTGSNANFNVGFTTTNGQVYYFAYPAGYGALTSILDANNFETLADWTATTGNITGLDGSAQSYRIYEFKNPVVAGSTNYIFKR